MANSLIDFSGVQPEAAGSFLRGFQQSQAFEQQQAAQERQNKLADLQLRAAQRGEEEALAEREAYRRAGALSQVPQELLAAGLGKQSVAAAKMLSDQQAAALQKMEAQHKVVKNTVAAITANPTRQNAEAWLNQAEKNGLDMAQYKAELAQIPDEKIKEWAFTHGVGADKAFEQAIIQLPGGGTAVEPKYALAQAAKAIPGAAGMGVPASAAQAFRMPTGAPGQPAAIQPAPMNALAIPPPGVAPNVMAPSVMQTPSGGRFYPPAISPVEQQRLGMEQRRLSLAEQAASPAFEQQMAAAKTTGSEQAKAAVAKQQLVRQIDLTIPELENATKKGGLIDQSTGSGAGRAIDVAAGFFGQATPGAIATSRLQPIANMALMMVPRFEGPQSDKDTQVYKEAAGQLANPTLPTEIRRQAGLEVLRLMKARKNQFVTGDMATAGGPVQPSAPSAAGPSVSNW